MNQREIKFRVWDNVDYMSKPFTLYDLMGSQAKIEFTHDCIVMQYTGLKDNNGQEIYEGDIVKVPDWVPHGSKQTYSNVLIQYQCIGASDGEGVDTVGYLDFTPNCEVIGNIYQNPELLQQ